MKLKKTFSDNIYDSELTDSEFRLLSVIDDNLGFDGKCEASVKDFCELLDRRLALVWRDIRSLIEKKYIDTVHEHERSKYFFLTDDVNADIDITKTAAYQRMLDNRPDSCPHDDVAHDI